MLDSHTSQKWNPMYMYELDNLGANERFVYDKLRRIGHSVSRSQLDNIVITEIHNEITDVRLSDDGYPSDTGIGYVSTLKALKSLKRHGLIVLNPDCSVTVMTIDRGA